VRLLSGCDQLPQQWLGLGVVALIALQFGQEFFAFGGIEAAGALGGFGQIECLLRQNLRLIDYSKVAVCLGKDFEQRSPNLARRTVHD
jgi:hypothetical protein